MSGILSCVQAEERLLGSEPAGVARICAHPAEAPALAAHLSGCESCRALAHDLASLASLAAARPLPAPAPLVEAALLRAAAEARALGQARRRALFVALGKLLGVLVVSLPLVAGWNAGVWALGARHLSGLPEGVLYYLGGVYGLATLAGLSALAFTLTLVTGAALRPPREESWLEA